MHTIAVDRKRIDMATLKVLLAEDNEVNQLLAKGILRHWGVETKTAENGFEVLHLLQKEDFDIVLMDIQMPEKSGIEAAREIRNLKDLKKKNIPIIALTANALKGEERKYITAGMDDFLTKPFKAADLYEVIERVLHKEGTFERKILSDFSSHQHDKANGETEKLYDFDQLEELAAGNQDFIVSLAEIFLDTIPPTSSAMVEATKSGDWINVSKLAHKLKSTIDTMNVEKIRTDIRTIELDAKNKVNKEAICRLSLKVNDVIHAVAAQIRSEFNL